MREQSSKIRDILTHLLGGMAQITSFPYTRWPAEMIAPLRHIVVLVPEAQAQVQILIGRVQVDLILAVASVYHHVKRMDIHQRVIIVVVQRRMVQCSMSVMMVMVV